MYWIRKFFIGIWLKYKRFKNNKILVAPPIKKYMKLLLFFLIKSTYIKIIIPNNMPMYADGICLEKKERAKNTGEKNQNFFSFFISASIKKIIDNKENITAWRSINGVPVIGYARIDMHIEYINAKKKLRPIFKKKK